MASGGQGRSRGGRGVRVRVRGPCREEFQSARVNIVH